MRSPFPADWVAAHAEAHPDAPAVDGLQARLSYAMLAERIRDLSGALAAAGVAAGDRVLVALPSGPASAVAALAVQAAGACAVEIDRAMGKPGLEWVAGQIRPRHAIVAAQDAGGWTQLLADRPLEHAFALCPAGRQPPALPARQVTALSPDGALPSSARGLPAPGRGRTASDDPALVLYTSGSTGRPRGVVHTARNIDANTRSIVQYLELGPADRVMAILPFHYTYGKSLLQTHLFAGGSVFCDPRFMYPRVVMEAIGSERCTGFAGVPMTFEILRRGVDLSSISLPSLRYLTQAGGPMRPETIRWVRQAFAPARLFVMYGQTEATARLSYVPPERGEEKTGSIGIAIPGVELQVVGEDGGPLPAEAVGHLVARGDNVTPGYLEAPEETAAILRDGWLWTGDLARRDTDGFFWLVGRAKELLKISGHRVSPVEIEQVLLEHPALSEAAVVGAEDPVQGEVAVAFVVLRQGQAATEAELRRFCRERLPPVKVPERVVAIAAIPRNPIGKPLRAELQKTARAERARERTS